MLKAERHELIIDILNDEHRIVASELSHRLNVSEDTIRRDLRELDKQGKLKRVHSGAVRVGPPITDFAYRTNVLSKTKIELARLALQFLKEDSVIIIDGSTTNLALVKEIPLDFKATIVTNSPPISVELAHYPNIEVINLGGDFYKRSMINIGIQTYKQLKDIRADLYVMGVYNIDIEEGTSVPSIQESSIKRAMGEVSSEILVMATNDKFGAVSNAIVADLKDVNYIVSDKIPRLFREKLDGEKIKLIDFENPKIQDI